MGLVDLLKLIIIFYVFCFSFIRQDVILKWFWKLEQYLYLTTEENRPDHKREICLKLMIIFYVFSVFPLLYKK